jgi:RNA polymerase sigma-70 factor, ECF subfamily
LDLPLELLVAQCLQGDEAAKRELVERYQNLVFRLCYRMLGQRQDAEDVAQETFLRALRGLAQFDLGRAFEPWLLTIAANRCRTALAARGRRRQVVELHETLADPAADILSARQLEEELHLALGRMRTEYRMALVLFHDEERSYAEMAEILDRPVGTIKTWVHRARQELLHHLRSRGIWQESACEL